MAILAWQMEDWLVVIPMMLMKPVKKDLMKGGLVGDDDDDTGEACEVRPFKRRQKTSRVR